VLYHISARDNYFWRVINRASEIHLEALINPLRLSISLRVVGGAVKKSSAKN
jgi:hypothetical protein